MSFNQDESWFSTHFYADGTARTVVMREGDAPSRDDMAIVLAVQLADRLPDSPSAAAQHFDANTLDFTDDYRALVRGFYLQEIRWRTVPGSCPRPPGSTSLAPTPGTGGGDGSPVVNQDKPGPGAIDVQHGASVDPSARAALDGTCGSPSPCDPGCGPCDQRYAAEREDDTPASTWLPGESDGTR
jgi:hypothetical protein